LEVRPSPTVALLPLAEEQVGARLSVAGPAIGSRGVSVPDSSVRVVRGGRSLSSSSWSSSSTAVPPVARPSVLPARPSVSSVGVGVRSVSLPRRLAGAPSEWTCAVSVGSVAAVCPPSPALPARPPPSVSVGSVGRVGSDGLQSSAVSGTLSACGCLVAPIRVADSDSDSQNESPDDVVLVSDASSEL
jgi:hypothetical protein